MADDDESYEPKKKKKKIVDDKATSLGTEKCSNAKLANGYKKAKGSAGIKGVDFQVNLLSVFLLNALQQNIKDWRLSTENELAGKFDDVVLELADGSAILLQAKHKESKKITKDQLFSINPNTDDFSLPKYFLSYLDIRRKFKVKFLMICTNTTLTNMNLTFLDKSKVCRENMLYCKDDTEFVTFDDDILSDLVKYTKIFHGNLKCKNIDASTITRKNAEEFLQHLQFYLDYPSGTELEEAIEKLLFGLKSSGNLLRKISYRDLQQKVKDWFEQPEGEYLTESRASAMFCEINSDKYRESLEQHKVFFRAVDFNISNSEKRILHIVAEGGDLLHLMRIYRGMKNFENVQTKTILYSGTDDGLEGQEQVIESFHLPKYTYLIIVMPRFRSESVISRIFVKLNGTLDTDKSKKVIIVAKSDNKLAEKMKSAAEDYDIFDISLTLGDLSEDTQEMLLRKKSVTFQGESSSLQELFPEQITDDNKKLINAEILEKMVTGEKITVGMKVVEMKEDISRYYIDRKFERIIKELDGDSERVGEKKQIFSEEDFCNVDEKIILISDSAGTGKTTVLTNLAMAIKQNNPRLWVIRIELNRYTHVLSDALKNRRSISVWELLNYKDSKYLTNALEEMLFSLKGIIVLMLDGVDEISPDYKHLILDLLLQSQKAENLLRVFVATRTYMAQELEARLKVKSFKLVPLTEQNQIDFFVRYWTHSLRLEDGSSSKCVRYAKSLISKVSCWITSWYDEVKFVALPLHTRMLAEVFLKNNGLENWEGCKEYLSADNVEPKLPERMNIAKLYEMFMEKIRDIFLDKANPTGNTTSKQALLDQFKECLTYHRSLALEAILEKRKHSLFSCYKRDIIDNDTMNIKVLKIGIVQKVDDQLSFVHRTFAEYFVAESMLKELQIPNEDAEFQEFLIDEVFSNLKYDSVCHFLDNILQEVGPSLPSNIFRTYKSLQLSSCNYTLIHKLARDGNTEIIRLILKSIDFKHIKDGEESKLGHFYEKVNTLDNLQYSVERFGVNIKDNRGQTPLHWSVHGGHLDTVKFLVEMGADVNSNSEFGGTALHLAVDGGKYDIAQFLLEREADVNVANRQGYTALHFAAQNGSLDIVEILIKYKAGINIPNSERYTALHFACQRCTFNIVKILVENGANIDSANKDDYTALHLAAKGGSFDIVELLVERGVDISAADVNGNTALHFAAESGSFKIVQLLVECGVDINIANKFGITALHFAAQRDSFDIVEFLVGHGVDIDAVDERGCAALHFASNNGSFDTASFLVECGACINIASKEENTALHLATRKNNYNIVRLLVHAKADIDKKNKEGSTALNIAAEMCNYEIVEFLVQHHADVNIADNKGITALQFAVWSGSAEIAELLVKNKAEVNNVDELGVAALHLAAKADSLDIVECLLKHGADINIANGEGLTALHYAVRSTFRMVEHLVEHGANINFQNKEGSTALHVAAEKGNYTIAEFLVTHGADVNIVNKQGYTALDLAKERGLSYLVNFLMEHGRVGLNTDAKASPKVNEKRNGK